MDTPEWFIDDIIELYTLERQIIERGNVVLIEQGYEPKDIDAELEARYPTFTPSDGPNEKLVAYHQWLRVEAVSWPSLEDLLVYYKGDETKAWFRSRLYHESMKRKFDRIYHCS